jgi:hypothetical protein
MGTYYELGLRRGQQALSVRTITDLGDAVFHGFEPENPKAVVHAELIEILDDQGESLRVQVLASTNDNYLGKGKVTHVRKGFVNFVGGPGDKTHDRLVNADIPINTIYERLSR